MTDNSFEIETTALALDACILLPDFAAAYPSVIHSWIFCVLERIELPEFICRFLRRIYYDSTTHVEFAGTTRGQFPTARELDKDVQRAASCFRWLSTLPLDGFKMRSFQGSLMALTSYSQPNVRTLTTSLWLPRLFET